MATYAIGDVQGCYSALMQLLDKIEFDDKKDTLWFTGDLINRGPHSLETLRFIKALRKRAITVLGNHDLTFLAIALNAIPYDSKHHTFADILQAEDRAPLTQWLLTLPLLHHDNHLGYTLVHAGLHPKWDLALAKTLAHEIETQLKGPAVTDLLANMYGNEPEKWDLTLTGFRRARFIINCFTRMRYCNTEGTLELITKESIEHAPKGFLPWFEIPNRANQDLKIIFGHWASLQGKCNTPNVFPLDTGCVWGNCLTAMRLEDKRYFSVSCS